MLSSSAITTAVRKAEVLLAIQPVISHMSHNSINRFGEIFKMMFQNSEIASEMQIGMTKKGLYDKRRTIHLF